MKIAKLTTWALEAKAKKTIHFGAGAYDIFTATLVELETADGITGIGECIARRAPRVTETVVRDLLWPVVKDRDPHDVGGIWDEMFQLLRPWGHYRGFALEGMSGIDQALWEILAKDRGISVAKALGGAGRERVPVYGSKVYTKNVDDMAREASEQVEKGHRALKIQLGRSPEWGGVRADVEVCRAIREAIGPDVQMGADVNCAYDAATAIKVGHEIAKYDLWFLEEPVYPDDLDGYELIRRSQPVPIAAGESEFGLFGFRELLKRRAVDIVQPDVARIGGFTAAMRLGAMVQANNLRYAPHTGFSCGVAQLASVHLSAAVPNLARLEEMFIDNPLRDVFMEPFPISAGAFVEVPSGPGLGLTLDRRIVDRFRIG